MKINFKLSSIRTRLLLIILPLMIISLGAVAGLSYYFANQYLSRSVEETAMSLGSDYSNQIMALINERVIEMEGLASNQVMHSNDTLQIVNALSETAKRTGNFDNINALSLDGSGVRLDGSKTNVADRDYFKAVSSTKQNYISDPSLTRGTGKLGVIIAVPVLEDGKLVKIVTGNVSLQRVTDLIKEVKFKDSGYATIIDDGGLVIAHSKRPELNGKLNVSTKKIDPDLKVENVEVDDNYIKFFQEAKSGKKTFGRYTDMDGIKSVGIFVPIKLVGGKEWVMAISAPEVELTREVSTLSKIMFWVVLFSSILTAFVVLYISTIFAKPIVLMRDEALLLAKGDLRQRQVAIQSSDEIGQLANAFKEMAKNLHYLIVQVQMQANSIASSSEQLTAGAQQSAQAVNQVAISITQIAQGTERQATAVNSMSDVAGEISVSIGEIAHTGKIIEEAASDSTRETERGHQAIEQAMLQMKQINQGSDSVQRAIGELAKGSQEISEIVSLIASIAGQTNLLALNAAIEAARAGEHGRGFAVVAEEVRKLAEGSNQAAKRISDLIKKNEIGMNEAIAATRANSEAVDIGINVVKIAGTTFENIAGSVVKLSNQISEISDSINQIAVGSQGLVGSVQSIDGESKANTTEILNVSALSEEQSASMQEIASASQVLAKIASALQESVVKFKV